jgi:hypothetical protein
MRRTSTVNPSQGATSSRPTCWFDAWKPGHEVELTGLVLLERDELDVR